MDDFKRIGNARFSVGGWQCYCCGPKPGKERKVARRYVRRSLKSVTRQIIETAIVEGI